MANVNVNSIEKKIQQKEEELIKEKEELIKNMNAEEYSAYITKLVEKLYSIISTFDVDLDNFIKRHNNCLKELYEAKKIKEPYYKNLTAFEYSKRIEVADNMIYQQMNRLHFMERAYKNIIYKNSCNEIIFITKDLTDLIELYNSNPSEELLSVIEKIFRRTPSLVNAVKKLPVPTSKHFEFKELETNKDVAEYLEINVESYYLVYCLEEFNSVLKDLEEILPEEVIVEVKNNYLPETYVDYYNKLLELGIEKDEALEKVATSKYIDEQDVKYGYLYESIRGYKEEGVVNNG